MTILYDLWLVKNGKANTANKTQIKKIVNAKKNYKKNKI